MIKKLSVCLILICLYNSVTAQKLEEYQELKKQFHLKANKHYNGYQMYFWLGGSQLIYLKMQVKAGTCNLLRIKLINYTSKYEEKDYKSVFQRYVYSMENISINKELVSFINRKCFWNLCKKKINTDKYNYLIKDGCMLYIEVIGKGNSESLNLPNLNLQNPDEVLDEIKAKLNVFFRFVNLDESYILFLKSLKNGIYQINSTTTGNIPKDLSGYTENGGCY